METQHVSPFSGCRIWRFWRDSDIKWIHCSTHSHPPSPKLAGELRWPSQTWTPCPPTSLLATKVKVKCGGTRWHGVGNPNDFHCTPSIHFMIVFKDRMLSFTKIINQAAYYTLVIEVLLCFLCSNDSYTSSTTTTTTTTAEQFLSLRPVDTVSSVALCLEQEIVSLEFQPLA